MRKERFPTSRDLNCILEEIVQSKFLNKINNNVYKVDIPYEYSINVTFNVSNLYLFDVCDNSRLNSFKDKGNDENQ
jgi:hypothetical protein